MRKDIIGKWECAISATASTSDIVFIKPSGDYTANFTEDTVINSYKLPSKQKKIQRRKEE